MLIINERQMLMHITTENGFVQWYTDQFMPNHLPEFATLFEPEKLRKMIRCGRRIAIHIGFVDPASQVHFVTLMWKIGSNFFRMPGFREIAEDKIDSGPSRIDRFYRVSSDQAADAILAADDRFWFYCDNMVTEGVV